MWLTVISNSTKRPETIIFNVWRDFGRTGVLKYCLNYHSSRFNTILKADVYQIIQSHWFCVHIIIQCVRGCVKIKSMNFTNIHFCAAHMALSNYMCIGIFESPKCDVNPQPNTRGIGPLVGRTSGNHRSVMHVLVEIFSITYNFSFICQYIFIWLISSGRETFPFLKYPGKISYIWMNNENMSSGKGLTLVKTTLFRSGWQWWLLRQPIQAVTSRRTFLNGTVTCLIHQKELIIEYLRKN